MTLVAGPLLPPVPLPAVPPAPAIDPLPASVPVQARTREMVIVNWSGVELIRAIREGQVGDVLEVRSSDKGSRADIPKWIEKAGHRLIGVTARDGDDEIVVEKRR